jgi:hypothetical protein
MEGYEEIVPTAADRVTPGIHFKETVRVFGRRIRQIGSAL